MAKPEQRDPYAPPPMHHDRSGRVVRLALIVAMLGAGAWAHMSFADQAQQEAALTPQPVQEQQMADAGYQVSPSTIPAEPAPQAAPPPAPSRSAPAPRRSAAAPEPQQQRQAPPPPATPPAPTPIPPLDLPPSG